MEQNEELEEILGKIYQFVEYKKLKNDDLFKIKEFCDKMIERSSFIDKSEKFEFKDFKIQRQEEISADYIIKVLKTKACPDNSMSGTGEVPSGIIANWRERYDEIDGVNEKYNRSIKITKEVAQDIFKDTSLLKIKIYLGEDDNGLVFLTKNESENNYFIISNTSKKWSLKKQEFDDLRTAYELGLKSYLDKYIRSETGNQVANNTRRFILGRKIYEKLIAVSEQTSNSAIVFYPVIYLLDDYVQYENDANECVKVQHIHRLTFLMVTEYYTALGRYPFLTEGVYDRNGLCPPPDGSNC
ncbi:hypothetical protein [uncultured Chryseobacterium sp.]|uniref:hypothetical protein n=1 Tax=uncultured Chryseobacterium sp. TaxID=259322 RepID=UPI0025DD16E7|nr:hypothetical protein [uncultured Chryseobacterium sp.]